MHRRSTWIVMVTMIVSLVALPGYRLWRSMRQAYLNDSLHEAIEYSGGDPGGLQDFLDSGAAIEYRDFDSDTPLLEATGYAHIQTVKLLLERGANVNVTGKDGDTPLMRAAWAGQSDIVRELLARGADIRLRNKTGKSALMRTEEGEKDMRQIDPTNACHADYPATIALLKQAGAIPSRNAGAKE